MRDKRDVELKNFFEFIRNRSPCVIAISGNSSRSLSLKSKISETFKVSTKQQLACSSLLFRTPAHPSIYFRTEYLQAHNPRGPEDYELLRLAASKDPSYQGKVNLSRDETSESSPV